MFAVNVLFLNWNLVYYLSVPMMETEASIGGLYFQLNTWRVNEVLYIVARLFNSYNSTYYNNNYLIIELILRITCI